MIFDTKIRLNNFNHIYNITFLSILLILFLFPNYFYVDNAVSLRLATVIFIFTLFVFLIHQVVKNKYFDIPKSKIFWILLIYVIYVLINIYINQIFVYSNVLFRDFAEVVRIMGILIAFLCGYNIKDTFSYVYLKKIAFLLVIIYLILLVDFFYNVVIIRDLLELFYVSSFHRFYGTYGNVNYLWIISSFIVLSMLISYFVQNKKFSLKQLIYITLTLVVCALSVIMSGSNTNVLIFVLLFVIYFLLTLIVQFKIKNFILIAFLCSIICITFYNILINIEFLPIFTHRAEAIKSILLGNIYIIIEELSSRVNTWNNALPEIFDRFIIGHGSMKSGITILDNSYLMTLYRYGIVGLILELLLYLFAFIYLFNMFLKSKKYKEFYIYLLPLLLLLGYVISCIPANSFYELRLPYLLFFVLGYFNKQIQFA